MNEEVLQRLYESASVHFDMPDYEQFKADMENEENALTFRNSMSEYYDIPDEETFLSDIRGGEVKKKTIRIQNRRRILWMDKRLKKKLQTNLLI